MKSNKPFSYNAILKKELAHTLQQNLLLQNVSFKNSGDS